MFSRICCSVVPKRGHFLSFRMMKRVTSRHMGYVPTFNAKELSEFRTLVEAYTNRSDTSFHPKLLNRLNSEVTILKETFFASGKTFTGFAEKQSHMAGSGLLFERCGDEIRDEQIMKLLEDGEKVGIIGYPGIGEKSLFNRCIMNNLDRLHKGNLKCLFVRIDGLVLSVMKDHSSDGKQMRVSVFAEKCIPFRHQMADVKQFQIDNRSVFSKNSDIVFLIDFSDEELKSSSVCLQGCNTFGLLFVAASNGDVSGLFSHMVKTAKPYIFIVDRLSEEQAEMCCERMFEVQPDSCPWGKDSSGNLLTKQQAAEVIKKRIKEVGPILRYITADEDGYIARYNEVNSVSQVRTALKNIGAITAFESPEASNLIVGLALKPHVTIPRVGSFKKAAPEYYLAHREALSDEEWDSRCYHFTFVSEKAKEMVLKTMCSTSLTNKEVAQSMEMLKSLDLHHALHEYMVNHVLCPQSCSPIIQSENTSEMCSDIRDPGCDAKLTTPDDVPVEKRSIECVVSTREQNVKSKTLFAAEEKLYLAAIVYGVYPSCSSDNPDGKQLSKADLIQLVAKLSGTLPASAKNEKRRIG